MVSGSPAKDGAESRSESRNVGWCFSTSLGSSSEAFDVDGATTCVRDRRVGRGPGVDVGVDDKERATCVEDDARVGLTVEPDCDLLIYAEGKKVDLVEFAGR